MSAGSCGALVGVDVGTSAVKVLAVTPAGHVVASATGSYPLDTPRPGWVEQDAEAICSSALKALRDVLRTISENGSHVAAIGFSSAMHGLLPVDAAGRARGPLVTWMDRRAAEVAQRWREDGTGEALYARTGAPLHPMLPSCKLRWFAEQDPAHIANAAKFVSMKELIVFRLTGEWLIDWGLASATGLFDIHTRVWSDVALAAVQIEAGKLSTAVAPSTTLVAPRTTLAADIGLPHGTALVLGSSDGALANLGTGAVRPGDVAVTLGTSGAVRSVVARAILDEHGRTFCYAYDDTKYIVGGPTSSAGGVLDKLQELFLGEVPRHERFARALDLAQRAEPGAGGLTVMPFLSGERAPYWLAALRGGIVGLDLTHTRGDVMRAAFESVVFALASVFGVLSERIGETTEIRLSGGLSHAPFVRQLVADIFARRAVVPDQPEASAFGAATFAGISAGLLANERAAVALLEPLYVHEPDAGATANYAQIFARYRDVVDAYLPLYSDALATNATTIRARSKPR